MTSSQYKYSNIRLCLCLFFSIFIFGGAMAGNSINSEVARMEKKADVYFIRKDFNTAMQKYEQANKKLAPSDQKDRLQLKMARLYVLLQRDSSSIALYESVKNSSDTLLSVNDVCFFLDALMRNKQGQKAEAISRSYAFSSPYSRDQRYINEVKTLSSQRHYYAKGYNEYLVKRLDINTNKDEYWIGDYKGELIYSGTNSEMHDPLKVVYHRSQYFALNDGSRRELGFIPLPLQNGPVAFKADGTQMLVTAVNYNDNLDRINSPIEKFGVFTTEIYVSDKDIRKNRWSKFVPLFPQDKYRTINYAHPFYVNQHSIIFSSDREGGYGGMDIYICNWDPTTRTWGDPINLGPEINTQGDEIHPTLRGNILSFSSNGHEGYGGYDIFEVVYANNRVLNGSISHLPYPINSVYNDFALYRVDEFSGYFVSDRNGHSTFDDIYSFKSISTPLNVKDLAGVYDQNAAIKGVVNVVSEISTSESQMQRRLIGGTDIGFDNGVKDGTVLLTLYYEFNDSRLSKESVNALNQLINDKSFASINAIDIVGYADELGTDQYNMRLSDRRAVGVRDFIQKSNIDRKPDMSIEGRGRLTLPFEVQMEDLKGDTMPSLKAYGDMRGATSKLSLQQRIAANKRARKVDIIVRTSK